MSNFMLDLSDQLTLYSAYRSSCSTRARLAFALKGIKVNIVPVDLDHKTSEFNDRAPSGMVPVLAHRHDKNTEDVLVIAESMAILEYIEEMWPNIGRGPLLPADPKQRAAVRSLCQVVISAIQPLHGRTVQKALESHGVDGREWARQVCQKGLRTLQSHIQMSLYRSKAPPFCLCDRLTLADVVIWPFLVNSDRFGLDMTIVEKESPVLYKLWKAFSDMENTRTDPIGKALWAASYRNQPDTPAELR